jgi:hypothetical protein
MTKYQINGDNNVFRSLRAAKHHVFLAYTQEERIKYLNNTDIIRYENDMEVTRTRIYVTTDGYSFGKTIKL